jgi:NhaA family Na+:H+ antiporter
MTDRLERWASLIVTVAAVAVAGTVVRREFARGSRSQPSVAHVDAVENWREILPHGRRMGNPSAPISIIEFADLECPFCRRYNSVLHAVRGKHPDKVSVVFVHLPLPMHRFALHAARVAECAALQGRFGETVDALYASQDSFGLKPWAAYARDAGVGDTMQLSQCLGDTGPLALVDSGLAVAGRLGIVATPTILVNGWKFSEPPGMEAWDRIIESVENGGRPHIR